MKIIIIGGGVGGINLLEFLNKRDPTLDITLIKKEKTASLSTCGLPYLLEGVLKYDDILLHDAEFYRKKGIDFRTNTEVKEIDLDKNVIKTDNEIFGYDKLIIATGRKPYIPKTRGVDLCGVRTFSNEDDGLMIKKFMKEAKNGAVIGGGSIGLSTAVAFAENGIDTKVIIGHDHVLSSILDPDMAEIVEKQLEEMGIGVIKNSRIDSINGKNRVKSIFVNGIEILSDVVVISKGTIPNVDLARNAGIEIGEFGGILTNSEMQVKRKGSYLQDVYAIGDCVEVVDCVTGHQRLSQLASTAVIQAKVIVDNIFGGGLTFDPCVSPIATRVSDLQVGSVGITFRTAEKFGIRVITGKSKKFTRARYYPGRFPITVKLLFNKNMNIIGAQIISGECVGERVNTLAVAIKKRMNAKELLKMERVFEPSMSLLVDATVSAVEDAMEKINNT